VLSVPPGAEVYVDGNMMGKTPYKFQHKRGALLRLEVRKHGFEPYYEELEPDADRTIDIPLDKSGRGGKKKGGSSKSSGSSKKSDPAPVAKPTGKTPSSGPAAKPSGPLPTGLRDPFKK
jgi:hypothetical protein